MHLKSLRRFARYASTAVIAALLMLAAACGGEPPSDADSSSANEGAGSSSPSPSATAAEYCAELYEFVVMLNTFEMEAFGNRPMSEPLSVDELIAEADRLAQWALDLGATTTAEVADALTVLSEALTAVSAGLGAGKENWEAMLATSEPAAEEARETVGTASTGAECA